MHKNFWEPNFWALFFINSQRAAKKLNVLHGAEKMLNLNVSWTVLKYPCKEVPSSTKLLFGYLFVSGVIDRTHILNHEQYHDNWWLIQAQTTNSNLFLCVMPRGSSFYSIWRCCCPRMINGVLAECYLGLPSSTVKHLSWMTWQLSALYSDTSEHGHVQTFLK